MQTWPAAPTPSAKELQAANDTLGHVWVVLRAMRRPGPRAAASVIAVLLLSGAGLAWLAFAYLGWLEQAKTVIAGLFGGSMLLAAGSALAAWRAVRPLFGYAAQFAGDYEEKRKALETKVAEEEKAFGELQRKIAAAENDAKTQRGHLQLYPAEVTGHSHRALLRYFMHESLETKGYEKHLGVISQARKSFETLNAIVIRRRELRECRERRGTGDFRRFGSPPPFLPAPCPSCGKMRLIELRTLNQCGNCRNVFDRAGKPMEGAEAEQTLTTELPDIDRIVLYVDDLDRCRHEQVVKVLEAVHLLLAFDLFVVVVGVDARWMRNALAKYYEGELGEPPNPVRADDTVDEQTASPDDYLEKIFQIPFSLRPLSIGRDGTYDKLIDSLTAADREGAQRAGGAAALRAPSATGDGGAASGGASAAAEQRALDDAAGATKPALPETAPDEPAEEGILLAEQLAERVRLTEEELKLLKAMGPLAGKSPRAVKRFVNIYRLIRSRRSGESLARFMGGDGEPGEFPCVILLLAVVTGSPPRTAAAFLAQLATRADAIEHFLASLRSNPTGPPPSHSTGFSTISLDPRIAACLGAAIAQQSDAFSADRLREVVPLVLRYSFHRLYRGETRAEQSGRSIQPSA